jgi:putative membrane protein
MGAMGSFIVRVLINGLALWIASWLLPGLDITTGATSDAVANTGLPQGSETVGVVIAYLFIGLIFGLVNAIVRPLVRLLSLPITILTLGLFTIVINAAMLYLTSWLSGYTPVHLTIDSFFWTAVLAAIIISVISVVAGRIPGARRR